MAEIGSVIAGKYEILTEIGHGGMSVVYLAMDTHLNKQWAVKEIRKKGNGRNDEVIVNSLLAEANMMKRLDHPSLPRIVDIIDNGVTIFVVMDYIEGESLDKILAEYGAQPEELVVGWAKQLCDALSYLHSQKPPIIYRDMKPANVMLKPEGNIKIIDFGIAREYKEQNLADTTVLGTKGYAPPEQYSGQTDARSDIFALGMTMHHLLTGIDPRTGEAYAPVRMWNPEVSEGVEMIIDKCVQPAPENRYQNCQDLLYDLEHPELITRDYKKKQKIKLNSFVASIVLAIVCVISGVVCNRVSVNMNNGDYEVLVSTSTASSLDEKISNYKKAIDIYPMRTDAYFKMIEAYEDEGKFGKNENDTFLAVYNAHKDEFDNTSVKYGEMQDAEAQDQGIGDRIIYLKHIETGEITEKIVTSVNKLDNEKPYNVGIEFPEATEKDDVKYYGDEITVTFTAYDNTSGVSKFNWEYTRADGSSTSILEADSGTVEAIRDSHDSTKYVGTLTLPRNQAEQLRGNLKVSATDVADNTCDSYTDTGVFVVDTIAPTQTVSYQLKDGVGTTQTVDTKHYFSNDVVLTFDIVEANFFASDVKIFVSKNGGANQLQTLSWETTENIDENEAKLTLSEDGDYVISMSYEDRSGKVMTSYISDTVVVDKTIPVLEFDYKDYTDTENPQSAIVTITEHNFRASDIEFDVITKNIAGQSVIGNDLQQYLRNLD